MKKFTALVAVGAALVVAGCGSSSTTSSSSSSGTGSSTNTSNSGNSGSGQYFHDMNNLSVGVVQTYNTNYSNGGPQATNATCISTGTNTAECNMSFADGTSSSIAVDIAADGKTWISH